MSRCREKKQVEMAASDVVEYCPMDDPSRPISTASSVSTRPLDEIALLKKGCLTSNYERRHPITLEELAHRGLRSSSSNSASTGSSELLQHSLLTNPVIDSAIYDVGLPEERAKLKIRTTTRGDRYELFMDGACHAVLDLDPEVKTLVTFRN